MGIVIGRTTKIIKVMVILDNGKTTHDFIIDTESSGEDVLYILKKVTEIITYDELEDAVYYVDEYKHDNFIDFTNSLIKIYNQHN